MLGCPGGSFSSKTLIARHHCDGTRPVQTTTLSILQRPLAAASTSIAALYKPRWQPDGYVAVALRHFLIPLKVLLHQDLSFNWVLPLHVGIASIDKTKPNSLVGNAGGRLT